MPLVNGLPRATKNSPNLHEDDLKYARFNHQFVLNGSSPQFPSKFTNSKIIAFLEYVETDGNFTVADAEGNVLTGTLTAPLDMAHSPMRLDGGVKINGTVLMAKGYFVIQDNLEV
jgi:hypothetical protein